MPYVEGFGTWPFGEEWLWEAMATCYLPLLDVLDERITVSVTPVLADQLEAEGVGARFLAFCRELRAESHRRDVVSCPEHAAELERSRADYERAARRYLEIGGDLVAALRPRWTSAATHAVLPLLATDAGIRLQVELGIAAHRRRTGAWEGGFWLPECAYAPHLDAPLADAGVRCFCLDLTDHDHPPGVPLRTAAGPVALPLDREVVELVWAQHAGYPAHGAYRDYHALTPHHHRVWANDGSSYDRERAAAQARADAADFVARVREREGLVVCALDTELLGHWWFEGLTWLGAVLAEADRQGLALATAEEALARHEPRPVQELPDCTWGIPRDLSTWSGPPAAELAWQARRAELRLLRERPAGGRAVRELLALQSSDWAFLTTRRAAGPYPRERAAGHASALAAALDSRAGSERVRNLAPDRSPAALLV
jgi:1,4-alpha-glucan branching enzyme